MTKCFYVPVSVRPWVWQDDLSFVSCDEMTGCLEEEHSGRKNDDSKVNNMHYSETDLHSTNVTSYLHADAHAIWF